MSLAVTYGLYIVSSLMAFDPWHMSESFLSEAGSCMTKIEESDHVCALSVTSFIQYLFVSRLSTDGGHSLHVLTQGFYSLLHHISTFSSQSNGHRLHHVDMKRSLMLFICFYSVYAFSNVHDVSWGTKGSDKVDMDLGSAASGKGAKKDEVILAVPTEAKDINDLYADELKLLAEPMPKIKPTRSPEQKQEDYYKVGLWIQI